MSQFKDKAIEDGAQQAATLSAEELLALHTSQNEQLERQKQELVELRALLTSQNEVLTKQQTEVVSLRDQVNTLESTPAATDTSASFTFTVGKQAFRVVHGVHARNEAGNLVPFSPSQIAQNKELRESLAKSGSSAVEKI